jgi:hypothetical protein
MSGTFSQNYGPQFAGGVFQVASQFIGESLVESIRKQFPRRKEQRGDVYADQARDLLRNNFELIDPDEHEGIELLLNMSVQRVYMLLVSVP